MFMLTFKFNRKTAVFIVIMLALVLVGIVLLAGAHHGKAAGAEPVYTVKNEKSRVAYLRQYGWEVSSPALSESEVLIPRSFSDVFESYNQLQKQQGFDLSDYRGLEVELYTYQVLNYGKDVVAQLYVSSGSVIGADVHSTQLDGFMTGVRTADGSGCGPLSRDSGASASALVLPSA